MKSSRNVIKRDEWLEVLGKAYAGDPDASTLSEAAEKWGVSCNTAKARFDRAVRDGLAVKTQKRASSGQMVIAYKPAPKGKK